MTKKEFKNWTEATLGSRTRWTIDEVTLNNRETILMYRGGESGKFIEITPQGCLTLGNYEAGIPHIGEAVFNIELVQQFPSQDAAFYRVCEVGGAQFWLVNLRRK
jgi:hypothetical protein